MLNKLYSKSKQEKHLVRALTGGAAAAEALRQIQPDVMAVYPITPQTPIIETFAKMKADGKVNAEIIQVESEHSAMSAVVGAQAAGARTVTATSSQGLALMHEILYIASGLRLPSLMYVSARALSAPINIHGEHGDVMAVRDSGWIQIFAQNAQEVYDLGFIGLKLAEETRFPVMVVMDGFQTSHTTERVELLPDDEIEDFVGVYQPQNFLLNLKNPVSFGPLALQDSYFDFRVDQQKDFLKTKNEFQRICRDFGREFQRHYDFFEEYETKDAKEVIVIMGSVAGTVKEVVDRLREKGKKVGVLAVTLFRPFDYQKIGEKLAHAKRIAVLDRAMSVGAYPPLYTEVVNGVYHATGRKIEVASYTYGLGGRDTFQKQIEKVFADLEKGNISDRVKYLK